MSGFSYVARQTGYALITIFAVVTLNFFLFRVLPGTAVSSMARVPGANSQLTHALTVEFGLNKPKLAQYFLYLRELLHGNLGVSYATGQPVTSMLLTDLGNTIPMALVGTVVAIVIGVATGVVAAWRAGSKVDQALSGTAIAFWAMPVQWLALMMLIMFSGVLPSSGMSNPYLVDPSTLQHLQDVATHMILPATTVALILFGQFMLITRTAVIETLSQDYILTARAKGLTNRAILLTHAVRNAMLPITTLVALSLGSIVGGFVLIESVFSWPGIGRATYDAVTQRDYPMLQGAFLVLTISVVICNLIADLLYFKLDPRVRR